MDEITFIFCIFLTIYTRNFSLFYNYIALHVINISIKQGESLEIGMTRFKRACFASGQLYKARFREFFESAAMKSKRKREEGMKKRSRDRKYAKIKSLREGESDNPFIEYQPLSDYPDA